MVALTNNLVLARAYFYPTQKINFLQGIFILPRK